MLIWHYKEHSLKNVNMLYVNVPICPNSNAPNVAIYLHNMAQLPNMMLDSLNWQYESTCNANTSRKLMGLVLHQMFGSPARDEKYSIRSNVL